MVFTMLSSVPASTRYLYGIVLLLSVVACPSQVPEPPRVTPSTLQETIANELQQIKADTDQHRSDDHLGFLWARLASDYRQAGDFSSSESAYLKALVLLDHGPAAARRNYATTLDNFAMLYVSYTRFDDAEKYLKRALEVRKEVGIPLDQARTEQHMSEIDLFRRNYKEAENRAARALQTMLDQNDPNRLDIIAALNSLTYARCLRGHCEQGVHDALRSLDIARSAFGEDSVGTACALLAVGFAEWRLGRLEAAEETMLKAVSMLKAHLGPDSKTVLLAKRQYRDYLKSVHRDTEADEIEREIASGTRELACKNCINVRSLSNSLK
jgi:tetratricopeptide (TPR) repeat protein